MKAKNKNRLNNLILSVLSIAIVIVAWVIVSAIVKNEYVVPSVSKTLKATFLLFTESSFYVGLAYTLVRTIISVLISFVLALALAVLAQTYPIAKKLLEPIISIVRIVPTMAVLLIILLWSNPTIAPVIVASLVMFPMIYSQLITAFNGIDEGVINATKVFNLTKKQKVFKVFLPQIAEPILSQTGSNFSFCIKLIVSAEVMAYTLRSLGGLMATANAYFEIPRLMALTLISVLLGILVEFVFNLITKKCFKWSKAEGGAND